MARVMAFGVVQRDSATGKKKAVLGIGNAATAQQLANIRSRQLAKAAAGQFTIFGSKPATPDKIKVEPVMAYKVPACWIRGVYHREVITSSKTEANLLINQRKTLSKF